MSDLYPFEGKYFARSGGNLHYVDEGCGEPVLMLHGNPTWSFYYRNLIQALRHEYRTIAPDHLGCGRSDKPSTASYDYTLASRIDDVEALLEHLGIRGPLTLVVHDWGGMIGMGFAARHPNRIKRLIVLNTAAFRLPEGKRLPWSLRLARNSRLGAWLVRRLNLFCRGAARFCVVRAPMPRAVRAMYLAPYDSWDHRVAVLRFVQTIPLAPHDPGYEVVAGVEASLSAFRSVPTLICWGMRDFVFDSDFLACWEAHFPHAEVQRFEDAGHYVLEDAGPEIISRVRQFLAAHP